MNKKTLDCIVKELEDFECIDAEFLENPGRDYIMFLIRLLKTTLSSADMLNKANSNYDQIPGDGETNEIIAITFACLDTSNLHKCAESLLCLSSLIIAQAVHSVQTGTATLN